MIKMNQIGRRKSEIDDEDEPDRRQHCRLMKMNSGGCGGGTRRRR
jgi:hypothetical protein